MKSKYKITDYQSLKDAQAKTRLDIEKDWNHIKDLGLTGFSKKLLNKDVIPPVEKMESQDWRLTVCQLLLDFGYGQLSNWLLQPSSDEKTNWKTNVKQILDVLYQQNRQDLAETILDYIYTFKEKNEASDQLE